MRKTVWPTGLRWTAALLYIGSWLGAPSAGSGQPIGGVAWVEDTITSGALGQRTIYVATPEGYAAGKSSYPVLVMLDANDHAMFRLWVAQAAYLAANRAGSPPMIAVGIVNGPDRIHDMTPPATGSSVKEFKNAGGASAFADFILDEVLPHVRARYRTLPGVFLVGHSAGGLFALDVAARRPGAFQGIIATSPAVWFNDGTLAAAYADLLGRARLHPRLFVATAGGEEKLAAAAKRFADRMSTHASLKGTFAYRSYPDATHQLTPLAVADGLRFLFEPMSSRHLAIEHLDLAKIDAVGLNEAIQRSESTYGAAARALGLAERLPERILNGLGYDLLENRKAALAITVFQRNVRAYPESVNVYDSLADGFLAAEDKVSALTQLRMAVEVAHRTGVPVPAETQKKLEELEGKE